MFNSQGAADLPGLHWLGWRLGDKRGQGPYSEAEREAWWQTSEEPGSQPNQTEENGTWRYIDEVMFGGTSFGLPVR